VSELLAATGGSAPRKTVAFREHEFYVTDLPEQFARVGRTFLGRALPPIKTIRLAELPLHLA
jgi:hypothetical protein